MKLEYGQLYSPTKDSYNFDFNNQTLNWLID